MRVRDDLATVVDPKLVEKLGIDEKTELEMTIEERRLVISERGRLQRLCRVQPAPVPRSPRPRLPTPPNEPRYGFPKKQPW